MSDILLELETRVAAKRKELEDEERALATVRRMLGQQNKDAAPQSTPVSPGWPMPVVAQSNTVNFEDLIGDVGKTKKRTLFDEVRNVVKVFGDNEFTVAYVEAAMKKMGVPIDAKNPRARIGIALSNLVEEELIVKTFEGAGNVPHRYKLKAADDVESHA